MVVDHVRHVLRVEDAEHGESNPEASNLAVTALSCSLAGQDHPVTILQGSKAASLYNQRTSVESYYCSYGLNPDFRQPLESAGFSVSGVDINNEVRMMELRDHPFFMGTLFIPQARPSTHPLIKGFADAAQVHWQNF